MDGFSPNLAMLEPSKVSLCTVECEEENEDICHLKFRTDNESITESGMSIFSGSIIYVT